MALIEQQRQNQEHMLKSLATGMLRVSRVKFVAQWLMGMYARLELSNDIRGERLRFVEAMKEATQINVQGAFIFEVFFLLH